MGWPLSARGRARGAGSFVGAAAGGGSDGAGAHPGGQGGAPAALHGRGDRRDVWDGALPRRAVAFYAGHGIRVGRVLSDNGSAYRATIHALACKALRIRHLRTRPYRPQTNGKAERFIRTLLAGWAYGAIYRSSSERTAALDGWLWHYNHRRRHSSLGHKPPVARLAERTNLLGTYT